MVGRKSKTKSKTKTKTKTKIKTKTKTVPLVSPASGIPAFPSGATNKQNIRPITSVRSLWEKATLRQFYFFFSFSLPSKKRRETLSLSKGYAWADRKNSRSSSNNVLSAQLRVTQSDDTILGRRLLLAPGMSRQLFVSPFRFSSDNTGGVIVQGRLTSSMRL